MTTTGEAGSQSPSDGALEAVRAFWNEQACGEIYTGLREPTRCDQLDAQANARYALEPYLEPFARFVDGRERTVLEIGVGMGADHLRWAQQAPKRLVGVDLTTRAIGFTSERLRHHGVESELLVCNAEQLPFPDDTFDLVYSWGVLHHTPRTEDAIGEVHRVLRPGGEARIMIYHRPSIVGLMLWSRYALLTGRPQRSMTEIYAHYMESPGTKGYTVHEARSLMRSFGHADVRVQLAFGDLLMGATGQRHRGRLLSVARRLWPRWAVRRFLPGLGLALLINATK